MIFRSLILSVFTALTATFALADDLGQPSGDVILTVSGEISHSNTDGTAAFDLEMLKAMPATEFSTSTIWTEGVQEFVGVSLHDLAEAIGFEGQTLLASAVNDYRVEVPVSDIREGGPMIAYMRNGEAMSLREKGPLWIVYPYDTVAEYRAETIYSRSIWQLDRIEVAK